ncbi:MAG TPA: hypothetical protein VIK75_08395 [Calditerricola sp.]
MRVVTFTGDAAIREGVVFRGGGRLRDTRVCDQETDRRIVKQERVIA